MARLVWWVELAASLNVAFCAVFFVWDLTIGAPGWAAFMVVCIGVTMWALHRQQIIKAHLGVSN